MKSDSRGFTLIELIIVIIVIGILAAVISPIMGNQFQAYTDSSRRATLVQQAQSVMQQLEKDLYRAAPNTTDDSPVSGLQTIRLLILSDGTGSQLPSGRYDEDVFGDGSFAADDDLRVLGCITHEPQPRHALVASQTPPASINNYLANQSTPFEDGPSTPETGVTLSSTTACNETSPEFDLTFTKEHDFGDRSSFNRIYFVQGMVTYQCDGNALWRAQDFGVAPDDRRLVAGEDSTISFTCDFQTSSGTTLTPRSLQVEIQLTDSDADETVTLIRTFQLVNAP